MLTISFTITVPTAADLPLWRGKGEGVLGEDVVRDGEPDDKLDVLEGWLGTQQINKSTPAVPSVDSEKLDFISYPWLSGNQVRETAGRTSCQTN